MPGYADYQRTVNYDDPLLLNDLGGAEVEKAQTKGRFDVSRFAYVMGKIQFTKVPVAVRFEWFMAETGGEPIGERLIRLDNLTAVSAQVHMPNMGPWLQVKYEPESAVVKYKPAVRLMPSNRELPFESVPNAPAVLASGAFKLAAKATKLFRPQLYYGGPAMLQAVQLSAGAVSVQANAMLLGFEYERFYTGSNAAGVLVAPITLPFTAQEFTIENGGAAEAEVIFTIIPSITGSN